MLGLEPNTLSVDPAPLFLPTKRQRDLPSKRILAEQVGNHWFHRLEITGCASPGFPPQPLAAACRFWPQRPYLYSAQTSPYQALLHRARLRDSWANIQAPGRCESASRAHPGRREWLPGKSPVLKSQEALGAEEQLGPRRARAYQGRLRSTATVLRAGRAAANQ